MNNPTATFDPADELESEPVFSPRIPLAPTNAAERARKEKLEAAWAARVQALTAAGKTPVHRCVMENLQTNDYLILLHVQTSNVAH